MRRYVCVILGLAGLVAGCDGDILHSHDTDGYRCLSFVDVGRGPVRETWQCYDRLERVRTRPLVILTRLGGLSDGYGEVYVGAEVQPAAFRVQGIDRRWDFGCNERERTYPFSFVIEPDGSGLYYHFLRGERTTSASDFYDCEMAP